jgi:hypothetical protein
LPLLAFCAANLNISPAHADQRPVEPEDYYRFVDVTDPQVAPNGSMVAYIATSNDRASDTQKGAVWTVKP